MTSDLPAVRLFGQRFRGDNRFTAPEFTSAEIADATGKTIGGVLPTARVVAPRTT